MAQSDFAKNIEIDKMQIEHTDVMTGDKDSNRFLYYQLKMSILKAEKIDIIVSFLMESGVRMILEDLKSALNRGVQVRILTGNYLGITQPSALCLIKKELGNRVDLRFYNDKSRSFHPKSYIFHYKNFEEIYMLEVEVVATIDGERQSEFDTYYSVKIDGVRYLATDTGFVG